MSNIFKLLQDELKQEYYSGVTYDQIGERAGLSKGHIGKLINDAPDTRLAKLSLEKALLLFPKLAAAYTSASSSSQANISSPHAVAAGGDVRIEHAPEAGEASEKLEALTRFVLSSSLSDAEKVAAMRLLH